MKLNLQSLQFRPSLLPSIAALAGVALMGYLGFWQQERSAEKRALQDVFDSRSQMAPVSIDANTEDVAMRYRHASADGAWLARGQIFLDNQVKNGAAGYHVITPLKLRNSERYLLVNRGWIKRGAAYPVPPHVEVPAGQVSVTGLLTVPAGRFLELSQQSIQGDVWQNLTVERYRQSMHLDILPFVLLATVEWPTLEMVTERPDARADKHVEYMLTWYSLALTVAVLWVVLNVKYAVPKQGRSQGSIAALDAANKDNESKS